MKCCANSIFYLKCCFICLQGSYFCSLNAFFSSAVWKNKWWAAILFVYTWQHMFLGHVKIAKIFCRLSIFFFFFQKNGKFWSVCFCLFVFCFWFFFRKGKAWKMATLENWNLILENGEMEALHINGKLSVALILNVKGVALLYVCSQSQTNTGRSAGGK